MTATLWLLGIFECHQGPAFDLRSAAETWCNSTYFTSSPMPDQPIQVARSSTTTLAMTSIAPSKYSASEFGHEH